MHSISIAKRAFTALSRVAPETNLPILHGVYGVTLKPKIFLDNTAIEANLNSGLLYHLPADLVKIPSRPVFDDHVALGSNIVIDQESYFDTKMKEMKAEMLADMKVLLTKPQISFDGARVKLIHRELKRVEPPFLSLAQTHGSSALTTHMDAYKMEHKTSMTVTQVIGYIIKKLKDRPMAIDLCNKTVALVGSGGTGTELLEMIQSLGTNRNKTAHAVATDDEFNRWTSDPDWVAMWEELAPDDLKYILKLEAGFKKPSQ